MTTVPENRIRKGNEKGPNRDGPFVLYWMTSFRRLSSNYALQHAADLARGLQKPLVILETLPLDYPHASPRFHRFLLDGMEERARWLDGREAQYFPHVEARPGTGRELLVALGERAYCIVTDDFPGPGVKALALDAGHSLPVRLELVDSNGLLPLQAPGGKVFTGAYHFRRYLQKTLPDHLPEVPDPDPLSGGTPAPTGTLFDDLEHRWPRAPLMDPNGGGELLRKLPLGGAVPSVSLRGTTAEARAALGRFLERGLSRYHEDRNHPDLEGTSGLSPYLHFGLISACEVFLAVVEKEGWTPLRLSPRTDGKREGWWGMGAGAEAFLDQLLTWREVGFNMAAHTSDYTRYESLPDWARTTLAEHAQDERVHSYQMEAFLEARTHDPLWNAAQRQLLREGVIHNYLRMLWGKKILEWSDSPREALEIMIHLNDSLALDGSDPNSYSGIFWCLGRYDRGWPERPIYGKVRSMSSKATTRKVRLINYMKRFSSQEG